MHKPIKKNKAKIAQTYQANKSDRKTIKDRAFVKIFDKAFDHASHEFFVDLCLKIEDLVNENNNNVDTNNETLDSEVLEDKIIQTTKAMALKLWWHPFPPFQKIEDEIKTFYKKIFSNFYHDDSFLEVYNKTYDSSLDEVMNSHHTCCNKLTSVDVAICKSVEKHCEGIFERSFFEAFMEAAEEIVLKNMIKFLVKEFEIKFPFTPHHQSRIRNWIKREN